jgi:[ribosomal protein S5]-alanine N-acetyltransferase
MRLPLRTARLVIREMNGADWRAIAAYNAAPEFHRYLPIPPPNAETTRGFVTLCVARAREFPRRHYDAVLQERALGQVVGTLRLSLRGRDFGDLGYAIRPEFWNRGLATEAVRAALGEARDALGLREIWATVDPANTASCRVMEKLGFVRRAGEAGTPIKSGRPASLVYMRSLVAAEAVSERAV